MGAIVQAHIAAVAWLAGTPGRCRERPLAGRLAGLSRPGLLFFMAGRGAQNGISLSTVVQDRAWGPTKSKFEKHKRSDRTEGARLYRQFKRPAARDRVNSRNWRLVFRGVELERAASQRQPEKKDCMADSLFRRRGPCGRWRIQQQHERQSARRFGPARGVPSCYRPLI